ncbi:MAG TPA: SCO family protein [Allosphingosinicella sp.]
MNETAKSRILLLLSLLFGLALAACQAGGGEEPPLKGAAMGGPFTLTDHNGRPVTDKDFAGKYRIVYFGFTHCPDVCPTDLLQLAQAMKKFEAQDPARAARVQPLFITTDPERDTPAVMKKYSLAFHPRILGLTGTPEQIAAVAKGYAVYYSKGEAQPGGGYSVDHSRILLLSGPDGEPIALLPHDEGPEAIAKELDRWVK